MGELLADVSHQLKTPLATLMVHNELLIDHPDVDQTTRRGWLDRSAAQLHRMQRLIVQLLQLARLESGTIAYAVQPVAVGTLVKTVCDGLRPLFGPRHVDIRTEQCHEAVWGDPAWLQEALSNIIRNAVEHTPEDSSVHIEA